MADKPSRLALRCRNLQRKFLQCSATIGEQMAEGTRMCPDAGASPRLDNMPDLVLGRIMQYVLEDRSNPARTLARLCHVCTTLRRSPAINSLWPPQLAYSHRHHRGSADGIEQLRRRKLAAFVAGLLAKHRPCPEALLFEGSGSFRRVVGVLLSDHRAEVQERGAAVQHLQLHDNDVDWALLSVALSMLPNVARLDVVGSAMERVTVAVIAQACITSLRLHADVRPTANSTGSIDRVTWADLARLTLLTRLDVGELTATGPSDVAPLTSLRSLSDLTLRGPFATPVHGLGLISQHCTQLTSLRLLHGCEIEGQVGGWPFLKRIVFGCTDNFDVVPYSAAFGLHSAPALEDFQMCFDEGENGVVLRLDPEKVEEDISSLCRIAPAVAQELEMLEVLYHPHVPLSALQPLSSALPKLQTVKLVVAGDAILSQDDGASLAAAFPRVSDIQVTLLKTPEALQRDALQAACMCLGRALADGGLTELQAIMLCSKEWVGRHVARAEDMTMLLATVAANQPAATVDIFVSMSEEEEARLDSMREMLRIWRL